jgi:hypothetical protein
MIDVVPSGNANLAVDEVKALLQRDAVRLSRRYDAIVVVCAVEQASLGLPTALPIPDVIYCARAGLTPIAEVKRAVEEIEAAGARLRGVVLWDAADPILAEVKPPEQVERQGTPVPA